MYSIIYVHELCCNVSLHIQEQYVFIHDTLCEYLTCGDTSVAAHDLMSVISDMRDIDKNTGEPQYYTTFEVRTNVHVYCVCG